MKKAAVVSIAAAVLLAFSLLFAGCFSPWQGDEATLTISVGNGSSRTLVDTGANEQAGFSYDVIMTGPGGQKAFQFNPGAPLTVKVIPGKWLVEVRAIGDPPDPALWTGKTLRAVGEWEGAVSPGGNTTASVAMTSATEVSSWAQLEAAVGDPTAPETRKEIIFLKGGSWTNNSGTITITRPIELKAVEPVTIQRGNGFLGNFFQVQGISGYNGELTLKGPLTLDGNNVPESSSLIRVINGGKLTMYDGVTLENNKGPASGSAQGGGLYVNGATFTMLGGTIRNNSTRTGGGVYVSGGTFTMSGGTISGNTATQGNGQGGGVLVGSATNFTKTGNSIIYGVENLTATVNSNYNGNPESPAVHGHAVFVESSPAKYRDTTAGPGVNLDSGLSGSDGGWEN